MKHTRLQKAALLFTSILLLALSSCSAKTQSKTALKPNQGVYYSLFVRSFADSDGNGIGDFNGIAEKASYLEELGISGVWLLPICDSPSYHGYDVRDYYKVNSDYGTMEDFENMVKTLKAHNINVIIDMTFNHSSSENQWFIDSRNPEDPHRSWYRWITKDTEGYNINATIWGHKVFRQDNDNKEYYYSGLFDYSMPDFNLDNEEVRNEMKNILKFWMDKGVTGFRFDAAGHTYNTVKIKEGEAGLSKSQQFWKEMIDYTKSMNPESYSVGEVWENSSTRAAFLKGLDADFHFDMGDRIMQMLKYQKDNNNAYASYLETDYDSSLASNPAYTDAPFLTNHDQGRSAGLLKGDRELCKAAASLYMLLPGTPFIYYGEEIGMKSGSEDSTKRSPFIWGTGDKYTTTWEDSIYNKNTISLAEQKKDKDSLFNYYKKLIAFRNSENIFNDGKFTAVTTGEENVSSWTMEDEDEKIFVMVNVTEKAKDFTLSQGFDGFTTAFASTSANTCKASSVHLAPYGTLVIKK